MDMRKLFLIFLVLVHQASFGQSPLKRLVVKSATVITDADVLDYISRWETATSGTMPTADKNAFNAFILGLKSNSLWTKFTTGDIAPMYAGTAAGQAICIKGTVLTFVNTPTHQSTGVDWNGTDEYATTGWIPSTSASASSVHIAYYAGEDVTASARASMGTLSGSVVLDMRINQTSTTFLGRAYSATVTTTGTADANSAGFYLVSKESDTKLFWQRWGTTVNINTGSNTATRPTNQLYIGCLNNGGTAGAFDTKECRFASWGAGFTEAEATTYNTLVEALLDALGRGLQ